MADPLLSQLPFTLQQTDFPALGQKYQGKVRDTYRQGDRLVLITTDRLSAFDRVLTTIPFKGEVLNRISAFWFDKLSHVVKSHVLSIPDGNVTVARRCEPISIEMVVRGYLSGSLWRDYEKGQRTAYGLSLEPGMKKDQAFPRPIITPSTKAAPGEHDAPLSEAEILGGNLCSARDWARMSEAARGLFSEGQKWARSRGLILVDTKYEFGKVGDELVVMDEIHTPDCSRYWMADEYQARFARGEDQRMLDKENIRQWLIRERNFSGHGTPPAIPDEVRLELARKYLSAYERITGAPLALEVGDVGARIRRHLEEAGLLPRV